MKIAFDNQIFNLEIYGGISRYYAILAQEFLKLDNEVGVFAGIHNNGYLSQLPNDVVKGHRLASLPSKSGRLLRALNRPWVDSRLKAWNPDLIHETYYSNKASSNPATSSVTTVYDMIHELFPEVFSPIDRTSKRKRATLNRVEHIISISKSTKKDLVELFDIDEEKISVVHLGVDTSCFSPLASSTTEHVDRPFLLHVGRRNRYKNFDSVLAALASTSRLKKDFDVIAFGGGLFNSREEARISSLGFAKNQIRQVSGTDDKLVSLYHQATALIYPSLYEGFGLPPLEAMACACPVISSNTSSMPEVIANAGEYFDPTSIEDIRRSVEDVVYSSTRIKELKTQGLSRAKLFSWDKCAKETIEVYKEVVG